MRNNNQVVSVISDNTLFYPEADEFFSPDEAFPEYNLGHVAKRPNPVYAAFRQSLQHAGLDSEHYGTETWNPLGAYISPGQNVFILCNFVKHNITNDVNVMFAKCTHGSVLRVLIDYVLLALKGHGSIRFGNAPLQSADWNKVIEETGASAVHRFYAARDMGSVPVELTDLRQRIIHRNSLGMVAVCSYNGDFDACTPVDLQEDSMLDELYTSKYKPRFRVLDYDFRETEKCHSKGSHIYLINKHILNSDVVISVPKLKTHEKVGLTSGIKGCVGAVAHKDCLAHHRIGSPQSGGDEYPDRLFFLAPLSKLHDRAYTRNSQVLYSLNNVARLATRRFTRALSGSWSGNDTCWRMAVDLARILEYATLEGRLHTEKQRRHIMLTDGIIAGEGDGPLSPRPISFGYLGFSNNVLTGDYVNCLAMGFDPERIPMIRESFRLMKYPILKGNRFDPTIYLNGKLVTQKNFGSGFVRKFLPPREWRGYL